MHPTRTDKAGAARRRRSTATYRDERLEALIERLPRRASSAVRRMRRPEACWLRVPAGILLILGGFLAILPVFGLWMLPLGLVLLADDVPMLRRVRGRVLDWVERRHPHWLERRER